MDEYVKIRDASVQTVVLQNEEAFVAKSSASPCTLCRRQKRRCSLSATSTPNRDRCSSSTPARPACASLVNTLQRGCESHSKHVNFLPPASAPVASARKRETNAGSEGFSPLCADRRRPPSRLASPQTDADTDAELDVDDPSACCVPHEDVTLSNYVNFTRMSLGEAKCSCPPNADLQEIVETRFGDSSVVSSCKGVRRSSNSKLLSSVTGFNQDVVEEHCFNRIYEERDLAVLKMVGRKRKQRLLRVLIFVLLTLLLATIIALAIIWSVTSIVEHNRSKTQAMSNQSAASLRTKSDLHADDSARSWTPTTSKTTQTYHATTSTSPPTTTTLSQFFWGEWSPCSATCGLGFRQRFLFCKDERLSLEECVGNAIATMQLERCSLSTCTSLCTRACYHGGRCVNENRCSCEPNWTGRRCEIPLCNPKCENGGICINPGECRCPDGYGGQFCATRS